MLITTDLPDDVIFKQPNLSWKQYMMFLAEPGKNIHSEQIWSAALHPDHLWSPRCLLHFQKIIEEVEEMLNNLPGVTSVHGRFYDLSSKYYRIIGNHASYYKDALRYLGCVDIKDLPGERWRRHRESFVLTAERWTVVVVFHRDREAGEGVHTGTGWTLRRRSLQLRRAGGFFH